MNYISCTAALWSRKTRGEEANFSGGTELGDCTRRGESTTNIIEYTRPMSDGFEMRSYRSRETAKYDAAGKSRYHLDPSMQN